MQVQVQTEMQRVQVQEWAKSDMSSNHASTLIYNLHRALHRHQNLVVIDLSPLFSRVPLANQVSLEVT